MRFSDQIDPGSGALQNWQVESERLLFAGCARQLRGWEAQRAERRGERQPTPHAPCFI